MAAGGRVPAARRRRCGRGQRATGQRAAACDLALGIATSSVGNAEIGEREESTDWIKGKECATMGFNGPLTFAGLE